VLGCVPLFTSNRGLERAAQSKLVKPRVADETSATPGEARTGAAPGRSGEAEPDPARDRTATKSEARAPASAGKDQTGQQIGEPEKIRAGKTISEERDPEAKRPVAEPDAAKKTAPEGTGPSDPGATGDDEASGPAFKKHDHVKYLRLITNKAIDRVNEAKDSAHAALCKDSMTEQWSLTIYFRQAKTFSFVVYVWDEVDENWVESLRADKRPLVQWKSRLDYQTSGKDCRLIKEFRGG